MKKLDKNVSLRQVEIANQFLSELDKHIADLQSGQVETAYEVNQFAGLLFINPNHLSDTVKEVLGKSPCAVYEEKLILISKDLLTNTNKPISEIARILDFEPSHFTKFFKRFTDKTPKTYRKENHPDLKTEKMTI